MSGDGKQDGSARDADNKRSADFDPYYHWLGIPPDEQPANHYRLLGLRKYEDDPRVIESAADRQMNHVRTFQLSERKEESQRLLNELSAARLCLLSPGKKHQYDEQLTDEDTAALDDPDDDIGVAAPVQRAVPKLPPEYVAATAPWHPTPPANYAQQYQQPFSPTLQRRGAQRGIDWKQPHWIAAIVCGVLAVFAVSFLLGSLIFNRPATQPAQVPDPVAQSGDVSSANSTGNSRSGDQDNRGTGDPGQDSASQDSVSLAGGISDPQQDEKGDSSTKEPGVAIGATDVDSGGLAADVPSEDEIRDILANAICMFNYETGTYERQDDGLLILEDLGPGKIWGRFYGDLLITDGIAGECFTYTGVKEMNRIPEARPVISADRSELSISFWHRADSNKFGMLFDCGFYTSGGIGIVTREDKRIAVNVGPGNEWPTARPVVQGVWHHVVLVFNGTMVKLYLDGELLEAWPIKPMTLNSETIKAASTFFGGQALVRNRDKRYFHGLIDECAVLPQALSADDVQKLYRWTRAGNVLPIIPDAPDLNEESAGG